MTTSTYMAALAALDEAPREEVSQVFISPLGDQSTEVDAETETAAFVSRPDPMRESETKPISIEVNGVVCGRGRNPTLRLWPTIFSGKIDVFPGDRRSRLISSMTSVAPA